MSFLGSVGSMMKGSGLEEALENIYGANVVTHMISVKAISRTLREHFLIEAALVNKLTLRILPQVAKEHLTVNTCEESTELSERSSASDVDFSIDIGSIDFDGPVPTYLDTSCSDIL